MPTLKASENFPKKKVWKGAVYFSECVCNGFVAARLFYAFQLLPCARINIHGFHRVFAKLIWQVCSKPTKRNNLLRTPRTGGLGLSHLSVTQVVSRFLFLRDQQHSFLSAIFHISLADVVPSFVVSSQWGMSMQLRSFFKEVVASGLPFFVSTLFIGLLEYSFPEKDSRPPCRLALPDPIVPKCLQ